MIAVLAIMMAVASVDGRKGATSPAQLHEDQHLTEIGAANSPTLLENAHPCPRGRYRPSGLKDMECELCPRGTYGNTEGLTTKQCTANCPAGRYNDERGARTEEDCLYCPPGKHGASTGYQTRECGGSCAPGKYSSVYGLTTDTGCVNCPTGYRGWQCDWVLDPRKGYFTSTTGKINEAGHAYLDATNGRTGQESHPNTHPDGEWSADRYAGDYSGAWYNGEVAGAYPSNSWLLSGHADGNFDPAADHRTNIAPIEKIPSNKDP
ncbi:hypothetical protein TrCOL_g11755 [Triparma columacea]|uniref:Tyrosine-protein kinase ephrin type A/B receptor-like domain-containing protein n=1 Tax=Triparma columacea TaxID=722753 RepID=A0A9W7GA60_9STRA|nr:hypothetical protein TrCOL_g11755 [Triparma columacea]